VAEGFFVTEDALGGSVTDAVLVSATKGYAIVEDEQLNNRLVAFDPGRGVLTRHVFASAQYLSAIALAPDGTLWLADRAFSHPGIRIFDSATGRQLTHAPINVGLPPFTMDFLP
jgi:hypothetical protein